MRKKKYKIGVYLRYAKDEFSGSSDGSSDIQLPHILQFVRNQNIGKIAKIHRDDGTSAMTGQRIGLKDLLESVRNREINLVVVASLPKLSRSFVLLEEIFQELEKAKCDFHSVRESFSVFAGKLPLSIPSEVVI